MSNAELEKVTKAWPPISYAVRVPRNDGKFNFQTTLGNGQNFLTVTTSGGELLTDIDISADIGFTDLRQVRISGATAAVPEPSALTLCLAGATVLGVELLRRKLTRA